MLKMSLKATAAVADLRADPGPFGERGQNWKEAIGARPALSQADGEGPGGGKDWDGRRILGKLQNCSGIGPLIGRKYRPQPV